MVRTPTSTRHRVHRERPLVRETGPFHRRRVAVEGRRGRHPRHRSRDRGDARRGACRRRRRRRRRDRLGRRRLKGLARDARLDARRHSPCLRQGDGGARRRGRAAHHLGGRQAACAVAPRMGAVGRSVSLARRGGAPHLRPDRRKPGAGRAHRGPSRAGRRGRRLHRLELPGSADRAQGRAGARGGLFGCHPSVERVPGRRDAARRLPQRSGRAQGRRQPRRRADLDDLRDDDGVEGGAQGVADRIDGGRPADDPRRRRDDEASDDGARRQRADDRLRRRRSRSCARSRRADQIRQRRTGLRDAGPLLRARIEIRGIRLRLRQTRERDEAR